MAECFFWFRLMLPCDVYASTPSTMVSRRGCWVWYGTSSLCCCVHQLQLHAATSSVRIGQKLILSHQAEIAQLVARRSHNPKVVSSILTFRIFIYVSESGAWLWAYIYRRGPSARRTLPGRLELPTLRLTASRSNQLSYGSRC